MKVFLSSATHTLHAPRWYVADGTVRPCPDSPLRVDTILAALQRAGGFAFEPSAADPWPAIRGVHAADYVHYLQTIHPLWMAQFGEGVDVIPDTFVRRGGVKRPGWPIAQAGYYCFDMAAPITAGTFEAAVEAARCAAAAAEAVLRGESAAYALCRPPGHHAGADYCGGFCYLNNAAIAAQHLLLGGRERVAILDIDYHHGNGTQDIFYARRDVLFVSLHADPDTQYPYFWGHADEIGAGPGLGFTMNFPLARRTTEKAWLATLNQALGRIRDFRPEVLVVSLGVDTFEHDDVGDFGVSQDGFAEIGRRLKLLDLPTVLIQEGGYNLEAVGPCVAELLSVFTHWRPLI